MKNACVIIGNGRYEYASDDTNAVLNAFTEYGYAVDEIRYLINANEQKIRSSISEWKEEYDNLFVMAGKTRLFAIKNAISGVFQEQSFHGDANGAGIFGEQEKTLFLLALDSVEWGEEYAKTVCVPYLQKKSGVKRARIVIRTVGANSMRVKSLIDRAKELDGGRITYLHTRRYDEDIIEILYGEDAPKMLVDDLLRLFADGLDGSVYAMDDTPLAEQLITLLKLRGKKISVAESFTGGGIARKLTSVSGASEVYFEGLNTYNELSKIKRLGVSDYTLATMGAVSDQAAYEMAAGLIATGDCDISIATTGIAGPKSDRSMQPVGLCYIAVGTKESIFVYRYKFDGRRKEITETAINYALYQAYKHLKKI